MLWGTQVPEGCHEDHSLGVARELQPLLQHSEMGAGSIWLITVIKACTESESPATSLRLIPDIGRETGENEVRRNQGELRGGLDWGAIPAPHAELASSPCTGGLQITEQKTSAPFCFSKRLRG